MGAQTVRQHLTGKATDEELKPENDGSYSKLDDVQTRTLDTHLSDTIYARVMGICAYVKANRIY